MEKIFLGIIIVAIVILVAVLSLKFLTGEDSWICVNGEWIKHVAYKV